FAYAICKRPEFVFNEPPRSKLRGIKTETKTIFVIPRLDWRIQKHRNWIPVFTGNPGSSSFNKGLDGFPD
ncbi:MAG: hypothetical protein COV68_01425, partial [Nitrospirae bacterium CG11_big_fil_rev_8_21_14_0_20_41_14]